MGKDLMVLGTFRKTILKCHEALKTTDATIELVDLIMNGRKEQIDETIASYVLITSIQVR